MAKYQTRMPTFGNRQAMRFDGGKELAAALAGLSTRVSRRVTFTALRDAAEPMRLAMEQNAPSSGGGGRHLADEILIKAARVEGGAPAVAVGPSKGTFYGGYLEFGTRTMPAQPFARPAFDTTVQTVIDTLGHSLWLQLAGKGVSRPESARAPSSPISSPGRLL